MNESSTTTATPRRRWYQFSLRTLLVFMTVIGIAFGWLGIQVRQGQQQKAAFEKLHALGCDLFYDCDTPGAYGPDSPTPGPEWLRNILGDDFFRSVTIAHIHYSSATDADFAQLEALTALEELDLMGNEITDAGLAHVRDLTHLTILSIQGNGNISGAGLEHLKGLHRLEYLHMRDVEITDDQLKHLKGLTQLKILAIEASPFGDAGLRHLEGLVHLEGISLIHTQVTNAGITRLQRALPHCHIDHW